MDSHPEATMCVVFATASSLLVAKTHCDGNDTAPRSPQFKCKNTYDDDDDDDDDDDIIFSSINLWHTSPLVIVEQNHFSSKPMRFSLLSVDDRLRLEFESTCTRIEGNVS